MARDWEQVTGQATPGTRRPRPPRPRRPLRRQPRIRAARAPAPRAEGAVPDEAAPAGTLAEWHEMTPGERAARWAQLRAWVTWLHDRYELSVEERLPRCWASHPGLVEELSALMAWRQEIYGGTQPAGQAARYWHAELRQVLHAAATMYAPGCRTGHRAATTLAAGDPALLEEWAAADPLAGIPGIDLAAGTARRAGRLTPTAAIGAALDDGEAIAVPGTRDTLFLAGAWHAPASAGWTEVPGPAGAGLPGPATPPWLSPPGPASRHRPAPPAAEEEGNPDPWQA